MADPDPGFAYLAVDAGGRRIRGQIQAPDDAAAFVLLKHQGLSPVEIRPAPRRSARLPLSQGTLSDRAIAQFLSSLATLLKAGADMRTALDILARTESKSGAALARGLSTEISGGGAVDVAFEQRLPRRAEFVAALIAAGQASGDLASGLERAAELMSSRQALRDQLVSVLSYPGFVFVSTLLAIGAILLFVVPSLAPLVEDSGAKAPVFLTLLTSVSNAVRHNLIWIGLGAAVVGTMLLAAARAGVLDRPAGLFLLDGPFASISRPIIFGGYAIALGSVLTGNASMSEALSLATRVVRSRVARARLAPVAVAVREGAPLSVALESVRGFPVAVVQLAVVGEASGALGEMLSRAGRLEEEAAVRRIEAIGRVLGPALIVGLGGLIGLVMAGLLSGVTQLGQVAGQ